MASPIDSLSSNEFGDLKKDKPKKVARKAKLRVSKNETTLNFGTEIENGRVVITLPIRTVSEGNNFDPWRKKHARHKDQKRAVMFAMFPIKSKLSLPCKITLVRYAPRELDVFENLPYSLKWIADQVCAELTGDHRPGRADGDKRISIKADQVKSKIYAVKIILELDKG
jgi:hypothetical protein